MNSKQCLKYGDVASFSAQPQLSCPEYGAIYSKVEQALQKPLPRPTLALHRPIIRQNLTDSDPSHHRYVEEIRAQSLYPTFRALTQFAYFFMLVIAALILTGRIFPFFNLGLRYLIASGITAILIYIVASVGRELSLMLADLSDATVRMTANQPNLK